MKLAEAVGWTETIPLEHPYALSDHTVDEARMVFVALRTEEGVPGYGAAAPGEEITGESEVACAAALAPSMLDRLVGEDLRHLGHLRRSLEALDATPAARAALDMALLDAFTRHLGVPLIDFLGGRRRPLPTSVTLGVAGVEQTLEEAERLLGQGFRILKVKIGRDPEEDLERLERLRRRWPRVTLRVDANRGYDAATTTALGKSVRELGLELVEQPLPVAELAATRALPPELRRRLAADESLVREADALPLLERPRPFGIWNIKLMKCGGITPALRLAAIAESAGIELMWGCMDESRVSITAALHTALTSPATRYLDLDGAFELSRDPARGGFRVEDGRLMPLEKPGLGIDLEVP
jgi:L-alanine-DL-glutamate epimerase-like enolase superfamily enzyme